MLELQHLTVQSKDRIILEDVSFQLGEFQSLAIVGESGSGKSTLLKVLLGLPLRDLWIVKGQYRWQGEEQLQQASPFSFVGSEIAWISQQAGRFFYDRRTIENHYKDLVNSLKGRTPNIRSFKECMDLVGLEAKKIAPAYPFELSGGMMQRVAIALSLVSYPTILLADEPTSALDVVTKLEIVDLLARLKREEGLSLLLVTHDMAVAAALSDHMLVIRGGQVIEQGATVQLLESAKEDYTKELLAATPHLQKGATDGDHFDL